MSSNSSFSYLYNNQRRSLLYGYGKERSEQRKPVIFDWFLSGNACNAPQCPAMPVTPVMPVMPAQKWKLKPLCSCQTKTKIFDKIWSKNVLKCNKQQRKSTYAEWRLVKKFYMKWRQNCKVSDSQYLCTGQICFNKAI